jgi:hypothetical protein
MHCQIATLADSASDYQGKLCILGAFDMICARQFPVVHPFCTLALRILFEPSDAGTHVFTISCVDQGGNEVLKPLTLQPAMEVHFPSSFVPFLTRNVVLNLQNIRFEKPGLIQWHLSCNQKRLATIPLRVTQLEEGRGGIGPAG